MYRASFVHKQNRINQSRWIYCWALAIVIAAGIASRLLQTGQIVFDKYLGDALYAVMIYLVLRIGFSFQGYNTKDRIWMCLLISAVLVVVIEAFQLTGIPLSMRNSGNWLAELCSIVLGTKFGVFDLVAYLVGLVAIFLGDLRLTNPSMEPRH